MGADYLLGKDFTPFEACHGRIYPGLLSGYLLNELGITAILSLVIIL
jgi:hypothetical protein